MASRIERMPRRPQVPDIGRLAIPTVALLLMLGSGYVIYQLQVQGLSFLLLALCALCLGVLVIIRPAIGLLALALTATSVRVTIGTGTDSPIVASLVCACILLAGWAVHRLLHRQRIVLLPWWVTAPGLLLVTMAFVSFFWGRATLDPRITIPENFYRVQIAQASLFVVGIGLLFLGADMFRSRQLRMALTIAFVVVGALALPFRAFDALGDGLSFLNTGGLFGLWFVAVCWSNALVNRTIDDWRRFVLGTLALGWLAMAYLREGAWVSGWLPALVALLLVTLIARPRLGIIVLLLTIVFVAAYYSIVYEMLITQQKEDGSLGGNFGRIELWRRNIDVIQGGIILGVGPAGYALYYLTFVPQQAMSTHSNYIDILAQMGVLGVLGLFGLLAGLWWLGRRTWATELDDRDRATCAAVLGGLPALAFALWLGDWLIPFVYNQTIKGFDHAVYSWLMLAALCGLYRQQLGNEARDAAP